MLRSTMFLTQNSPTHFACRALGHLDCCLGHGPPVTIVDQWPWVTGAQSTAQAFEGDSRAENKLVARFQAGEQEGSLLGHTCADIALSQVLEGSKGQGYPLLPVGHPRFVERHEVDLARGTTFGAGEEYLEGNIDVPFQFCVYSIPISCKFHFNSLQISPCHFSHKGTSTSAPFCA